MDDYVQTILDLNEDITQLQNRIKYEQNKGIMMNFSGARSAAERFQKVIGLELMGLKDIASFVDEKLKAMIMYRVRNIEAVFTEELIRLGIAQKKYLEERDK